MNAINPNDVSPEQMGLYCTGELDDATTAIIEKAIAAGNEHVRGLLDETSLELAPSSNTRELLRAEARRIASTGPAIAPPVRAPARPQLGAALRSQVAELIRQARQGAGRLSAACLGEVDWHGTGGFRLLAGARAAGGDADPLAQLDNPVSVVAGQLHFNIPADKIPYGVARVLLRDETNELVATFLLALPLPENADHRVGSLSLDAIVESADPAHIDPTVQPAIDALLPDWFPLEEVALLLDSPAVADDAGLRADVTRLRDMVQGLTNNVTGG